MNTIKAGQTLTTRSICNHDCIFSITVLSRKGNFVTILDGKSERRVKVRIGYDGHEMLRPDNYSMAPIYKALPDNVVTFAA